MKSKRRIAALLPLAFSLAFAVNIEKSQAQNQSEEIEISIDTNGDKTTKKIIVNGKELSEAEIKEFEASGKMQVLHRNSNENNNRDCKIIVLNDDENASKDKHINIIKKGMCSNAKHKWITKGDDDEKKIEVIVEKDGDKTTEKIIVNGKELSKQEIKEFKKNGNMKILHLGGMGSNSSDMQVMVLNSDDVNSDDIDVEVIMEKLKNKENDGSKFKVWKSDDGADVKIIKKKLHINNHQGASLGIAANIKEDGWHLNKVFDGSGAADAGIKKGDIVKSIADLSLIQAENDKDIQELPEFKAGQQVKVVLDRSGKTLEFDVEARQLDQAEMMVELDGNDHAFEWLENLKEGSDYSKQVKVMIFEGEGDQFKLNTEDIHMLMPGDLEDINVFISDGKSTSTLLGKNHEMSTLSEDLGKYFFTKGGVLVLNVDTSNAFKLKDGDVIKSVNGKAVNTPKEVIKQLLKAKKQENIKLKIIRHKKNKTLKYQK